MRELNLTLKDWKDSCGPECPKCPRCGMTMELDGEAENSDGKIYLWSCPSDACSCHEMTTEGFSGKPKRTMTAQQIMDGALALHEEIKKKEEKINE
jgi:hypothetical protein